MPDDVRVTNWPSDEGGEAAAILKLWAFLRTEDGGPRSIDEHLALIRRCRAAIKGHPDLNSPPTRPGTMQVPNLR